VFLDEVGLQGCGDFVGRLQRVVDGPVPCSVVNHGASIAPLRALGVLGIHLPGGFPPRTTFSPAWPPLHDLACRVLAAHCERCPALREMRALPCAYIYEPLSILTHGLLDLIGDHTQHFLSFW